MTNLQNLVRLLIPVLACGHAGESSGSQKVNGGQPVEGAPAANPGLAEALKNLELPGVTVNVDEWAVDVTSKVTLREGLLELIACTPETKTHESIIAIEAKPSHVHTALLLLGAKPGTPAMMQPVDEDQSVFRPVAPAGQLIDVYLVVPGEQDQPTEMPISEFLVFRQDDEYSFAPPAEEPPEEEAFPTHSFIFAGSHLVGEEGDKRYLADGSGHVISITTFGDELLCLPGFHEHANQALKWQVKSDHLPPPDTEIILRLRPQQKGNAGDQE